MANTIRLKRSAVASAVPTTAQLALGELAINTYDGKLYLKKDNGTASIVEIGAGGGGSYLPLSGGTLTGDLSFSGNGRRITGDFTSNATITDRVMIQSSTTNGNTLFSLIPNGTATQVRYLGYNSSDPTNASVGGFSVLNTDVRLASTINGTGTLLPMAFFMGSTQAVTIDTSNRLLVGYTTNQSGDPVQVSGTVWSSAGFTSYGTAGSVFTANANGVGSISAIFQNTGGNLYIGRDSSTGSTFGFANAHVLWGSGASNPMVFAVAAAERFRFGPAGQLGIAGANYGNSGQTIISGGASAAPSWGTLGVDGGGTGVQTLTGIVKGNGASAFTAAVANTDYVSPTGADGLLTRWMFQDTGWDWFDQADTNSTGTATLNYTNGSVQRWAPTGTRTLATSNWPPSGALGELLIEGINLGAATITWPTINWVKSDGTTTTTFGSNGVTLQLSGTDWVFLWTRDGGTTIYGKVVR